MRAVKNADGTTTLTGRAIVFNQPSEPLPFIEYIDSGALDGVDLSKLLLLYAHDYDNVLSRADAGTLTTKIDENGLTFTATLPDTTLANDVRENINAGNLQGCSFGFNLPTNGSGETWSTRSDGVQIHHVTHIESVSELTITPIPAYTQTSVQVQRDLAEYLRMKGEKKTMETQNSSVAASSATSATSKRAAETVATSSAESLDEIIKRAVAQAVQSATDALKSSNDRDCGNGKTKKRDDDDADNADVDTDTDEDDDAQPKKPKSSAASSSENSSASSSSVSSSYSASVATSSASNRSIDTITKEEKRDMKTITPENNDEKHLTRDLHNYLANREMPQDLRDATAGVGLPTGSVLIPHEILTPDHEQHQFPRLGQYVNQISVSTTTGTKPYFETTNDVLQTKAEFESSKEQLPRVIKSTDWKLQSYAGKYTTSRDLLMDSQYDWVAELRSSLNELQDNTDDSLIATALLANPGHSVTAKDAVADLKTALNINLKPNDSAQAQIVLTQSAYDALDQLKDGFGRPLLQPDPTQATSGRLFGKTLIVVADELLGKAGDAVAVVAPLKKVITKFYNGQVSGQFLDNFDVFDVVLGLFVREDVKALRPDLVTVVKMPPKAIAASDSSSTVK